MHNNKNTDRYTEVTNKIIAALENNIKPWVQPWDGGVQTLPMRYNNKPYQGINTLILWIEAAEKQYNAAYWMTFKQAKLLGGNIRKGERASAIFYSGTMKSMAGEEEITEEATTKQQENIKIDEIHATSEQQYKKFMKCYYVFNVTQIDKLPEKYYAKSKEARTNNTLEQSPALEEFIKNTQAIINYGGISACYRENNDYIQMPEMQLFKTSNAYYATLFHELTHWTKHKNRLNRNLGGKRFGDNNYAMEELVAELGAAFISSALGITPDIREDHAPYIANWLKALKSDKRAIFTAATLAQSATNYLLELNNATNK